MGLGIEEAQVKRASPHPAQDIEVRPNPAIEGGTITIHGRKGGAVYLLVSGQDAIRLSLSANGEKTVAVPVLGEQEFVVSDLVFPFPSNVVVSVVFSSGQGVGS